MTRKNQIENLLLFLVCLIATPRVDAQGSGHPCGIRWPTIEVSAKTITALGNEYEIQTPRALIKSYVVSKIKKEIKAAATAKSKFLAALIAAGKTGKTYASYVSIIAEGFSTAGLIIDEVHMDGTFFCCDAKITMTVSEVHDGLFIVLRSQDAVKVPGVYVNVMVDLANAMVAACPGKVVERCSDCK